MLDGSASWNSLPRPRWPQIWRFTCLCLPRAGTEGYTSTIQLARAIFNLRDRECERLALGCACGSTAGREGGCVREESKQIIETATVSRSLTPVSLVLAPGVSSAFMVCGWGDPVQLVLAKKAFGRRPEEVRGRNESLSQLSSSSYVPLTKEL